MSVSIAEVITAGGYDLSTLEDSLWLLSQQDQLGELVERAREIVEEYELRQNPESGNW